jgi:hypothetical protein
VRWRGVSTVSEGRTARSETAPGVSLSLIRTNVAAFCLDIKHVFEVSRGLTCREATKVVGGSIYGLRRVQQFDHMFGFRTHYRLLFEQVIDTEPTGGTT